MEASRSFGVRREFLTALAGLAGKFEVVLNVVLKVVGIDEVLAGVIGRVDIDELHLSGVGFLEELEDFEVVAFYHEVLGRIPIDAVFRAWTQGAGRGGEGELAGASFAMPIQAVFLFALIYVATKQLLEYIEVNLPLSYRFRKNIF